MTQTAPLTTPTPPTDVTPDPLNPHETAEARAVAEAEARDPAVGAALQQAWFVYLTLAALPAPLAIVGIWVGLLAETSNYGLSNLFMLLGFAWLTVTVPLGFYLQRGIFINYRRGQPVAPRDYVKGMLVIWAPLAVAGVVGMLGWIIARTPLLAVTPSILALIVFAVFFPTGSVMCKPVGDHDDPENYEEPS